MKKLTEEVIVVKASLPDIKKYVVPAYTDMLEGYRTMGKSLPKREDDPNLIRFNIPNDHDYWNSDFSYHFTQGMLDDFCQNLAHNLDLSDHESVKLGEAYHAHGIGNNNRYPVIVEADNKEIHMGYINANDGIDFSDLNSVRNRKDKTMVSVINSVKAPVELIQSTVVPAYNAVMTEEYSKHGSNIEVRSNLIKFKIHCDRACPIDYFKYDFTKSLISRFAQTLSRQLDLPEHQSVKLLEPVDDPDKHSVIIKSGKDNIQFGYIVGKIDDYTEFNLKLLDNNSDSISGVKKYQIDFCF